MAANEQDSIRQLERALDEIRRGKMVILTDDEDRENEGDLVMAAEKVTPAAINFMIFLSQLTYYPTLAMSNTVAMKNIPNTEKDFPSIRVLGTIGWIAVVERVQDVENRRQEIDRFDHGEELLGECRVADQPGLQFGRE